MTYIVYFIREDGFISQWATIANSAKEARQKFIRQKGCARKILYVRRLRKQ